MYLKHYGILGMRWGIRRFQDKSGRLTRAGQKRYGNDNDKDHKRLEDMTDAESSSKMKKPDVIVRSVANRC